jgi:hypothetical protein|tara:strand:+ start:4343 stop:4843 length:501 start_codon:yes stop_codon:yes gene_type:complete
MWIKKINEFFDNMSEYDNSSLSLHFSVDLIDILKDRIKFTLDDECNVTILVLPFEDLKEETEVDNDGFLYWLQFTFHKELIDIILSLKNKFEGTQDNLKKLINEHKITPDAKKQAEIEKNNGELETLKKILSRVDTYRRNTFTNLRDIDSIENVIKHVRIYKEQSE